MRLEIHLSVSEQICSKQKMLLTDTTGWSAVPAGVRLTPELRVSHHTISRIASVRHFWIEHELVAISLAVRRHTRVTTANDYMKRMWLRGKVKLIQ